MFFQRTHFLSNNEVKFTYTKFAQAAMVDGLDPEWGGSCEALAYSWLYRKMCHQDIQHVTTYEITEPDLPHVVIAGVNHPDSDDIQEMRQTMNQFYVSESSGQRTIDGKDITTKDEAINNLINSIASHPHNYGVISSVLNVTNTINEKKETKGHALAFVKRNDEISFFDANNGEISFTKFSDFALWFKEEIKYGALSYMIDEPNKTEQEKRSSVNSTIVDSTRNEHVEEAGFLNSSQDHLSERDFEARESLRNKMLAIRTETRWTNKHNIYSIDKYKINFWYSDQYTNPDIYKVYCGTKCNLILMSEVSKESLVLKKALQSGPAFIIEGLELYLAYKQHDSGIVLAKLEIQPSIDSTELIARLNANKVKLKANEKAKALVEKMPPKTLALLDENTGYRFRDFIECKESSQRVCQYNRQI